LLGRTLLFFGAVAILYGQDTNFAGAMIGVSTLSADGRSVFDATSTAVSLYKPENGLTGLIFGGRHLSDFFSAQASYGWNGNDLKLASTQIAAGVERAYEYSYAVRHHTVAAELMIYFRPRSSMLRPYLSAGPGVAWFSSSQGRPIFTRGSPFLPPARFSATDICFRVAVGIDIRLKGRAGFRYSFAETIQRNPISAQMVPTGERNLANFQNLFGVFWRF